VKDDRQFSIRLTDFERIAICRAFKKYFCPDDHLWLFGSRVNHKKSGGDIDLYIETSYNSLPKIADSKIDFLVEIKSTIGDQRIDVIINQLSENLDLQIYKEAKETGVLLV